MFYFEQFLSSGYSTMVFSKKSSGSAEFCHKKWMKAMQKNFASPETQGYACSSCEAKCPPNNWEYHTFEPERGVLCFYSVLHHTSHSDSVKMGLNYRLVLLYIIQVYLPRPFLKIGLVNCVGIFFVKCLQPAF